MNGHDVISFRAPATGTGQPNYGWKARYPDEIFRLQPFASLSLTWGPGYGRRKMPPRRPLQWKIRRRQLYRRVSCGACTHTRTHNGLTADCICIHRGHIPHRRFITSWQSALMSLAPWAYLQRNLPPSKSDLMNMCTACERTRERTQERGRTQTH